MLTVKNENNHEVEKLLRDKMNELSESVDCFDRISARAFPEKDEDFSESGFTVSDLENVTIRARRSSIIKRTVLAVAAVICIAVIPQTNLIGSIMNIGSDSVKQSYENLISEISNEIQNGDYLIADYPLDYYIKNDVLVTPLFACPFEECKKEDVNVRIYTRQINGFNTNQVYAIEYAGDFSENNIIAAAQSEYTFSEEDIDYAEQYSIDDFMEYYDCSSVVGHNFSTDSDGLFTDSDGDAVLIASFTNFTLIKYDNGIIPVESSILYGHKTSADDLYFYDIISISYGEEIQIMEREKAWQKSIYFNGNTAVPEENHSIFTKRNLFHSDLHEQDNELLFIFSFEIDYKPEENRIISAYSDSGIQLSLLGSIILPYDDFALSSACLYAGIDTRIIVKSSVQSSDTIPIRKDNQSEYWKYIEELLMLQEEKIQAEQNPLGSAE